MDIYAQLLTPDSQAGRLYGLTVALVTNNQDPQNLGRVKVRFPWLSDSDESAWARVLTPMAGKDRGLYCLPEVDDEVLVAFEHGRVEFPYVLGALWNGKDTPPVQGDKHNDVRLLKSRSGHVIRLTDKEGSEKIEVIDKSEKNKLIIETSQNRITIQAQGDIVIKSETGKISLSGNAVEIEAQSTIKVDAKASLDLEGQGSVKLKGAIVNIN